MSRYAREASELAAGADIGHTARHVFLVLAIHANRHGVAWPTVETLGRHVGIHPANVRRALHQLVDVGLVEVLEQSIGRRSNTYRLAVPTGALETLDDVHNPRATARVRGPVDNDSTRAVARANPRGGARQPARWRAPEEVEEPKKTRARARNHLHDPRCQCHQCLGALSG